MEKKHKEGEKMRTIVDVKKEIETLKEDLKNVVGSQTEVYTRIVGYYRPVSNWNPGKKAEYKDRVEFDSQMAADSVEVAKAAEAVLDECSEAIEGTEPIQLVVNHKGEIKNYKLFYSDNCPGCPPVKHVLKQVSMTGEEINAGTREGFEEAIRFNITGTPTVLFFNEAGELVNKAHTPAQIERLMVA